MSVERDLAGKLLQIKAIKLSPQNPFTWASGWKSPIYCDNRTVLSYPEVRGYVIDQLREASGRFSPFEVVGGVATAGIPHGALLADRLGAPFLYVRSKPKGHGRQNQIEGVVRPGAKVLLIEDLISTGGSSLKAVEALRNAGCAVSGVLALFTYGFSVAEEAFARAACPVMALSNYDALLEEALQQGYIAEDQMEILRQWRAAPESWSA